MVVGLLVVGVLPVEAGGRDGIALLVPGLTTGGRLVVGGAPLTGVLLDGAVTALFTGRGAPLLTGLPALLGLLAGRLLLPLKAGLPPTGLPPLKAGAPGLGLLAGRAVL